MNTEKFQVGDYVIIQQTSSKSKIIGKIEEIYEENNQHFIKFNEFYSPLKTNSGKQDHNSKHELFKTDEIETEMYDNIISKCEVVKFDIYIKKLLANKDKKSNMENVYFFRQKYSPQDDHYAPDLPNTCYCNQIFNPDKNFIQCKKCKELIHMDCYLLGEFKKCFNSQCNNNIQNQLQIVTNTNPNMLNNKRKRNIEDEEIEKEKEENNLNIINVSNNTNVNNSEKNKILNESGKNELEKNQNLIKSNPSDEMYPNLSENSKKNLTFLIDRIEKKNNALNKGSSTDEKSRKNIKDKLFNSLLYGIEEIKENGDWKKMKNPLLKSPEISEETAVKICHDLSTEIETYVFLQCNGVNNPNYKKKLRTLYSNLSDPRNQELRFAILNDDIKPEEFVKMEAEELAPSSLKNRRTERQNKYFKEQVLMKEETKIIAKTHKGEAILTVDEDNNNEENYFININENDFNPIILEDVKLNENEEKTKLEDIVNRNKINESYSGINADSHQKENEKILNIPTNFSKTSQNKNREIKYKNLSPELINFYFLLDEYTQENIIKKFDEKMKNHLKPSTYEEIVKLRKNYNFNK